MKQLKQMSCEACRIDAPLATDEEITKFSRQIPDWEVVDVEGHGL